MSQVGKVQYVSKLGCRFRQSKNYNSYRVVSSLVL